MEACKAVTLVCMITIVRIGSIGLTMLRYVYRNYIDELLVKSAGSGLVL
jgi:hypothetical protein